MKNSPDIDKIKALLKQSNLPYEDIVESVVNFLTEEAADELIGFIGLEQFGKEGLIRSLAIEDSCKSQGLGKKLIEQLILKCKAIGVNRLHLLTTTASDYFLKYGFRISQRDEAPPSVLKSKEFSEICPASSVYMIRDI